MSDLKTFYQAHKAALTVEDSIRLPTACITPVVIDFARLPRISRIHMNGAPFSALFNTDFSAKIETLSPLSFSVLRALNDAGYDPVDLRYQLLIDEKPQSPASPHFWHTDERVGLTNYRADIGVASKIIKTVISNVFPTATLPEGAFNAAPDGLDRSLYFLCQLKGVAPRNLIKFKWRDAIKEFGDMHRNDEAVDHFVDDIYRWRRRLRQDCVVPGPGHAVHFSGLMPHAYTCRSPEEPFFKNAERRHRIMLDVHLR